MIKNNWQAEFPHRHGLCYLNHAGTGVWPRRTGAAVQAFAEENVVQGAANYPGWMVVEEQLRDSLARLINAPSPDDIALVKSTSEALSFVAAGLDWRAGDNLVLAEQEFPSNRYPWECLRDRGVEVRVVDLLQADTPEDALFNVVDRRTRLITSSAVQYANGLRMDLERIGAYCTSHNILFCVDAIQQLGMLPLDVQAVQADFIMADAHKWLLAPEGIGVFYCAREQLQQLKLTQFGWHMVQQVGDFDDPDWKPASSARRFECGSPNMLGIHALLASLSLFQEVGMENVAGNILENMGYLRDGIQQMQGFEVGSPVEPERQSGIVSFRNPAIDNEQLYRQLMQNNVICAYRHAHVRFAPHFYTSGATLDGALMKVKELAAKC